MSTFQPTHTVRYTFSTGLYGEVDVQLDGNGDGPARRADGSSRWSRRAGRWLFDGGTTIGGEEVRIEARPFASRPSSIELVGTPDQVQAQLEQIERELQQARIAPLQRPQADLDPTRLAALCGRWICHHNGWPPVIEAEITIADAEAGTIEQHVQAGQAEATSKLQVVAIDGDVFRIQRLDNLEVSRWRLEGDQLICGEPPLETVLLFQRRP